jgi:predicted metal-dependent HD superfamily phosphohydrolase
MVQQLFYSTLNAYGCSDAIMEELWSEIAKQHSSRMRHYHTLNHLDHMILQLQEVQPVIEHWNTIVLAVAYHDIIYNPLRSNNEERSAAVAVERLATAGVDPDTVARTHRHIIASKTHLVSADQDTNYFTDADLSVLGASREVYKLYADYVRKEYRYYPDLLYKPGRKKVLQHFLDMPRIFKTEHFYHTFEQQARQNLLWELEGK